MNRKNATHPSKTANQATHPETRRTAKRGTPGTESSKVSSTAKDVRSGHDKDGNSQQRAR